jgi:hypothetical protein
MRYTVANQNWFNKIIVIVKSIFIWIRFITSCWQYISRRNSYHYYYILIRKSTVCNQQLSISTELNAVERLVRLIWKCFPPNILAIIWNWWQCNNCCWWIWRRPYYLMITSVTCNNQVVIVYIYLMQLRIVVVTSKDLWKTVALR